MKDMRKGKIVTIKLGEDKLKRVPHVFETIYRMVKTPVDDKDNPDDDETFFLHTLQTVDVEGVAVVDGGKAVCINGDFDISLEDEDDEEKYSVNKTWRDKEEAIEVWAYLTDLQLKRAEKLQQKIEEVVNCLRTSKDERQY